MLMYLGIGAAVAGTGAAIAGFTQQRKMKRLLDADHKKTGELTAQQHGTGPKALYSAEGKVVPGQVLTAPCSGQQCVYYEIKVEQKWEKQVRTENGMKKQTGTTTAHSEKQGCVFAIDDGSGPVAVNALEGVSAKMEKAFDQKNSAPHGHISFGNYSCHIGPVTGEGYGTGTRCIETIVPASGDMFAMGKLAGGQLAKPDGMMGKLLLSNKGRDSLIGATKRNMMIGYVSGALLLPGGGVTAAVSDPPEPSIDYCENMTDALDEEPCNGRLYDTDGATYSWTVATAGTYKFSAVGTGTDEIMRLWPSIEVTTASGDVVLAITGTSGAPAEGEITVEPGDYSIFITDTDAGWLEGLQGGAGFRLEIDKVGGGDAAPAGDAPAGEAPAADEKAEEAPAPAE